MVRSVVGGSVGKWSVVGWLMGSMTVDLIKPKKKMFGVVISPVHLGRGLFCNSNFIFFLCIDDKEKNKYDYQKQSLKSLTIPKDI